MRQRGGQRFQRSTIKWTPRVLLSMMAVALTLSATSVALQANPAGAVDTGGYPYANATDCSATYGQYSWCIGGTDINPATNYAYRNCTDYVAWKIQQVFGVKLPTTLKNANTWGPYLQADGYRYDSTPQVGDIAAWNTGGHGFGHVAYVYAVSNGVASLDEYNVKGTGLFTSDRTTAKDSAGAPSEFVHIGSPPQPPTLTSFAVTPSTVDSAGGSVSLSAQVADANICTFSSNQAVAGLPSVFPCTNGTVNDTVSVPANTGKTAETYTFDLSATGTTTVKAVPVTLTVGSGDVTVNRVTLKWTSGPTYTQPNDCERSSFTITSSFDMSPYYLIATGTTPSYSGVVVGAYGQYPFDRSGGNGYKGMYQYSTCFPGAPNPSGRYKINQICLGNQTSGVQIGCRAAKAAEAVVFQVP